MRKRHPIDPDFYENYGIEWSTTYRRDIERMDTSYKISNLCALMEGLEPKRIVDFGCGLGDALNLLARRFQVSDAVGIDISSKMISSAREQYPHYTFIEGSVEKLKDIKADLITFIDVLEHLEDIRGILDTAKKCASIIAIKIPLEKTWLISCLNKFHLKSKRSLAYESEGHLYEFNRSEVEEIIKKAGLHILKYKTNFFMTKEILFSDHVKNRMKTNKKILAKLKYIIYMALKGIPYPITHKLLKSYHGVDFFVICKPSPVI